MKVVIGTDQLDEEEAPETATPEASPTPPARFQKHKCPECNHVADYNYGSLLPDGSLICVSCRGKFVPSTENEVN